MAVELAVVDANSLVTLTQAQREAAVHGARMFGVRVKDFRQAKGWTQDDLAKRMTSAGYQMHQTTVAKMESGARPTSVEEMFALAAVFQVSVDKFFLVEDDARVHLELAGQANVLATIANELADLARKEGELREQYEAAQSLYHETERRLSQQARFAAKMREVAADSEGEVD